MARKSYQEKLHDNKDLPKIVELTDPIAIMRFGGPKMLIAPAELYDEVMRTVPIGKVTTSEQIRRTLAKRYDADFTCQLTAGIFINIVAHASEERQSDETPYWRTLKKDGELNEKYPGGMLAQKQKLEVEGLEIISKGKRYFVKDYQANLV